VTIRGPDPFAAPAEPAARDDPFARARAGEAGEPGDAAGADRSDTLAGPLAQRDPHAPVEESAVFQLSGPTSLDDLLRRARLRGFLAGALVGGALVVGGVAVASWWMRPVAATVSSPIAAAEPHVAPQDVGVVPPPGAGPAAAPEARPPAAVPAGGAAPHPAGRRRGAPAPASPGDVLVLPALELSAPGPAAPAPRAPSVAAPSGGLELAEVSAALDARREAIERCTADHPVDATAAAGRRFHLVLTVAATGRVADAALDDAEVGAADLGGCLVALAREIRFPPFEGDPVRVELPLRLAVPR
jgi:hypothetical protein